MKMKGIMVFVYFGLWVAPGLCAQTFQEWIRVVNHQSLTQDQVKMTMEVSTYDKASKEIRYKTAVMMIKHGEQYGYQTGDVEVIYDGHVQLVANHSVQTISLSRGSQDMAAIRQMMSPDSILGYYSHPVKVSEDAHQVQYKVQQNNSPVTGLLVTIDKANKRIDRVVYDYETNPMGTYPMQLQVEMVFNTTPLTRQDLYFLNQRRLVTKGIDEKIQLAEPYKDYTLELLD